MGSFLGVVLALVLAALFAFAQFGPLLQRRFSRSETQNPTVDDVPEI